MAGMMRALLQLELKPLSAPSMALSLSHLSEGCSSEAGWPKPKVAQMSEVLKPDGREGNSIGRMRCLGSPSISLAGPSLALWGEGPRGGGAESEVLPVPPYLR